MHKLPPSVRWRQRRSGRRHFSSRCGPYRRSVKIQSRARRRNSLDHPRFGNAGISGAALTDRPGGAPIRLTVGNGAGSNDGARTRKGLVLAAWAMRAGKSKFIPAPASGRPKSTPLRLTSKGRCRRPPSHAAPSSSGVTATGEKDDEGFDWKKPNPLASSAGMRLRNETSLIRTSRTMDAAASALSAPIATSLTMTPASASKSMPKPSSGMHMGARGAKKHPSRLDTARDR